MKGPGMRGVVRTLIAVSALAAAGATSPTPVVGEELGEPTHTAALSAPAMQRPHVVDLRFGRHPDKTRIVIELSERTAFKVEASMDPPRVTATFADLAPGTGSFAEGPGVDLIDRYHQESDGVGRRLVFAAGAPVRVREAFLIPPRDGRQSRLVIDVERGDPAESAGPGPGAASSVALAPGPGFLRLPGSDAGGGAGGATIEQIAVRDDPIPPRGGKPTPPPQTTTVPVRSAALIAPPGLPTQKPGAGKRAQAPLVVIDPGHGGGDPGAVGVGGVYEKDITLAAARELRRQLLSTGRYRVKLTRDSDVFIRLRDRVGIAREAGADLFISLHADALGSDQVRGLSIYTLSGKASDREAEMLAAKENRADAIVGMDLSSENQLVASILIDLAQRDTMNHSKKFASYALSHLSKDVRILASKPQREAGFAVLTAPDVPSVLVEMGYLSNPVDAKLLSTAAHREKVGRDMANAVDAYFGWLGKGRR